MKKSLPSFPELELVAEAEIRELLGHPPEKRFEASGVCVKDGVCHVIFDNIPYLARIHLEGTGFRGESEMVPLHNPYAGYEDIAHDPIAKRFYLLIEAHEAESGGYQARIEEYDEDLNFIQVGWADFKFKHDNKGLEGLSFVYFDEQLYLLGLCEGNSCKGGRKGQRPGAGRILVLQRDDADWRLVKTLKLPKELICEDYSSVDVDCSQIMVVSQASSLLWLGHFQEKLGKFADEGHGYLFPRGKKGKTRYCNIEGIAWLGGDLIVTVSDKRKKKRQPKRCKDKDQSIQLFRIPNHRPPGLIPPV